MDDVAAVLVVSLVYPDPDLKITDETSKARWAKDGRKVLVWRHTEEHYNGELDEDSLQGGRVPGGRWWFTGQGTHRPPTPVQPATPVGGTVQIKQLIVVRDRVLCTRYFVL